MKGSKKKWQSNSTDSVIGMLMGFDEAPPQRLVSDKHRVLCESYLHNVASISARQGSSLSIERYNSSVSRVRSSNVLDKCVSPSFSKKNEHSAARRVLRRQQKLEYGYGFEDVNFDREVVKSLMPEFTCEELVVDGNVFGHSCGACTRSTSAISPPERRRSKFEPHLLLEQSSLANKSRRKYFERRKTGKKVRSFGVSKFARNLDVKSRSSKEIEPNLAARRIHNASFDSEEAVKAEDFTRINIDPLLKSHRGVLLEEGARSSNVEGVVSREESVNELSEEESAYSKCSGIGPVENLRRTSQHSPDSVLESRDTGNPPPFDSIGLMLQLEALNFELEETLSEGSAIAVSGDEDFGDLSRNGRKIKKWLGDDESRSFSYLVDVLDEAGFYDTYSFMDLNKWASLECPISPLVFDALEKKYGKQTSWQKCERQLLFDRINSGLLEIYYPVINFHDGAVYFRKKTCSSFRRDEVEDELWTMLIGEANVKSKDLNEKALDKWWEYKEGVSIICGELEASLFDELVMELAGF